MSEKSDYAAGLMAQGYNCAQAVVLTFGDDYDLEWELAQRLSCGLGSGCCLGEVCGAVSGGVLVLGLKYGPESVISPESKEQCY